MKMFRTASVFAILALGVVAGCGGGQTASVGVSQSDSPLVKAAKGEGALTWYSGEDPAFNERVAKGFEKRYGIKVDSIRAVAGDLERRFSTEAQAGTSTADVMNTGTPGFFADGLKKGWFISTAALDIPSLKTWPQNYIKPADAVISITPFVLGYNTDLVKSDQVPDTWNDLLKPDNRGRLELLDPRAAPAYLSQVQMWNDKLGPDFVRELGAARPTLSQSSVPGAQALAAGEKAFLFPTLGNFLQPLIDQGAPIKTKVLDPTTGVEQHLAISARAPHPNAAKLFEDWILSPEGQDAVVDPAKVSPARVKEATNLPPNYVSPEVDKALANRDQLLALLGLR